MKVQGNDISERSETAYNEERGKKKTLRIMDEIFSYKISAF